MTFKAIDNATFIALQPLDNRFCIFIPHEDIATIATAHYEFRVWPVKIHALDCLPIPVDDPKIKKNPNYVGNENESYLWP